MFVQMQRLEHGAQPVDTDNNCHPPKKPWHQMDNYFVWTVFSNLSIAQSAWLSALLTLLLST